MININIENIKNYAIATGVEGAAMYGADRLFREGMKSSGFMGVVKTLKQWTEPILFWTISLVIWMLFGDRLPELVNRAVRAIGSLGVMKAIGYGILDYTFVLVVDNETIEAFNLDPNAEVEVYIDGTKVSFQTPPKTDGSGHVTIKLPSPLSDGTHKILVHTKFKAASIEAAVPG